MGMWQDWRAILRCHAGDTLPKPHLLAQLVERHLARDLNVHASAKDVALDRSRPLTFSNRQPLIQALRLHTRTLQWPREGCTRYDAVVQHVWHGFVRGRHG